MSRGRPGHEEELRIAQRRLKIADMLAQDITSTVQIVQKVVGDNIDLSKTR